MSFREKIQKNKKAIILAEVTAAVVAAAIFGFYQYRQYKQAKAYEEMQAQAEAARAEEEARLVAEEAARKAQASADAAAAAEAAKYCDQLYDFDTLQEENEDIYAWINVPGTDVDYPILQNAEDNYYLLRNLDGSSGHPGCLYTNASFNTEGFSDPLTIIYGHNMPDMSMFGTLHYFDDAAFFQINDEFYIYTRDHRYTYEIYSVRYHNDLYLPYEFNYLQTEQDFQDFIDMSLAEEVDEVDHTRKNIEVTTGDKLVVLSTCMETSEARFLVFGKLVEVKEFRE